MSRRKQEKPQPRKQQMTPEADVLQDILTCGVCQKEFALSDIVKFIQHKVHTCNKENYLVYGDTDQDDFPDKSVPQIVGNRRPSISAPISKKGSLLAARLVAHKEGPTDQVPRLPNYLQAECNSTEEGGRGFGKISPKPKVVDVDTNTTITEPNSYTCATCKQIFTSAWVLVQHVQNMHGMKIYVESHSNRSTPASIPPSSVTQDQVSSLSQHLSLDVPSSHSALQLLRMPLSERQFGATLNNPFSRPSSHDFRMELLNDQYSRLNNHGLNPFESQPHPFERGPFDRGSRTPLALSTASSSFEPQLDFYSQRLRQLAGATSPNAAAAPTPVGKLTPTFNQTPVVVSSSSEPTTPTPAHSNNNSVVSQSQPKVEQPSSASSTSSNGSKGGGCGSAGCSAGAGGGSSESTGKQKACEFCGKTFRFLSNLIVHRRSHTGEKPYKCQICNHACTQASKLKRHMKTHRIKTPGEGSVVSENNSVGSARSTPDSTAAVVTGNGDGVDGGGIEKPGGGDESRHAADEDSDGQTADNEEEEELEEEEEDDELDEEEDLEDEDDELECVDQIAEDLSTRGSEKQENRQSLLGEVMEKIGLSNIQQYNEAYKQALEESLAKSTVKQERPSSCTSLVHYTNNGPDREFEPGGNNKMIGQPALDFGQGLLRAFDSSYEPSGKRLKLEMGERESLYAGLWLPSVPPTRHDLFLGESLLNRHHKSSSSESALKSITPSSFGGSLSPRPGTSGGLAAANVLPSSGQNKLKDRRNDTCEYCGKVFKNCSNLTVHRRSHTGEKPYKCELCSYACAQSSKLTRHMKTHGRLGKDVYRCRFCNMPFSVPSTLEKHMRKCVVNQNSSTPELILELEKDSDSKEMTS